jgi:monothiol glutaredoxin
VPRPALSESAITEPALSKMQRFHAETIERLKAAIGSHKIVVVGMMGNPHCRRARRVLTEANKPFEYIEIGSYLGGWRPRLAIKLWSGWPTFPQVFVDGRLVGGADEITKALADQSV